HLHALEEDVEHLLVQLDAPEPQVIEQVLEDVGHLAEVDEAEHPRDPLERVHAAEDRVDEIGVRAPRLLPVVEHEEITRERLDDLLRLRDELLADAIALTAAHFGSPFSPAASARTAPISASAVKGLAK